ncbi:MAG: UDP-N-acetylmuramate--L-alanine ligase, partial [Richelia sp.]|nr:UDP-N-acetylmuramate--L-alanine ligase [Richelia sp.]
FLDEFAQSFAHADAVIITDIYSAGEVDLGLVSGEQLATEISRYHEQVIYQPTLANVCDCLLQTLGPGDLTLFLGAGNLNQIIPEVINTLRQTATVTS